MEVIARHYSQPNLHHDRDPKAIDTERASSKATGSLKQPKIKDLPLKPSSISDPAKPTAP